MADVGQKDAVTAQVATVLRDIGLCASVLTAVLGLMRAGDLVGLINFLQTEPAMQVAGLAVATSIVLWRQWNARHVAKKLAAAK